MQTNDTHLPAKGAAVMVGIEDDGEQRGMCDDEQRDGLVPGVCRVASVLYCACSPGRTFFSRLPRPKMSNMPGAGICLFQSPRRGALSRNFLPYKVEPEPECLMINALQYHHASDMEPFDSH